MYFSFCVLLSGIDSIIEKVNVNISKVPDNLELIQIALEMRFATNNFVQVYWNIFTRTITGKLLVQSRNDCKQFPEFSQKVILCLPFFSCERNQYSTSIPAEHQYHRIHYIEFSGKFVSSVVLQALLLLNFFIAEFQAVTFYIQACVVTKYCS